MSFKLKREHIVIGTILLLAAVLVWWHTHKQNSLSETREELRNIRSVQNAGSNHEKCDTEDWDEDKQCCLNENGKCVSGQMKQQKSEQKKQETDTDTDTDTDTGDAEYKQSGGMINGEEKDCGGYNNNLLNLPYEDFPTDLDMNSKAEEAFTLLGGAAKKKTTKKASGKTSGTKAAKKPSAEQSNKKAVAQSKAKAEAKQEAKHDVKGLVSSKKAAMVTAMEETGQTVTQGNLLCATVDGKERCLDKTGLEKILKLEETLGKNSLFALYKEDATLYSITDAWNKGIVSAKYKGASGKIVAVPKYQNMGSFNTGAVQTDIDAWAKLFGHYEKYWNRDDSEVIRFGLDTPDMTTKKPSLGEGMHINVPAGTQCLWVKIMADVPKSFILSKQEKTADGVVVYKRVGVVGSMDESQSYKTNFFPGPGAESIGEPWRGAAKPSAGMRQTWFAIGIPEVPDKPNPNYEKEMVDFNSMKGLYAKGLIQNNPVEPLKKLEQVYVLTPFYSGGNYWSGDARISGVGFSKNRHNFTSVPAYIVFNNGNGDKTGVVGTAANQANSINVTMSERTRGEAAWQHPNWHLGKIYGHNHVEAGNLAVKIPRSYVINVPVVKSGKRKEIYIMTQDSRKVFSKCKVQVIGAVKEGGEVVSVADPEVRELQLRDQDYNKVSRKIRSEHEFNQLMYNSVRVSDSLVPENATHLTIQLTDIAVKEDARNPQWEKGWVWVFEVGSHDADAKPEEPNVNSDPAKVAAETALKGGRRYLWSRHSDPVFIDGRRATVIWN